MITFIDFSMLPSIKNTPLPAVPKTLSSKILKTNHQERKSSISSGIYEDILNRKSVSYLQLGMFFFIYISKI